MYLFSLLLWQLREGSAGPNPHQSPCQKISKSDSYTTFLYLTFVPLKSWTQTERFFLKSSSSMVMSPLVKKQSFPPEMMENHPLPCVFFLVHFNKQIYKFLLWFWLLMLENPSLKSVLKLVKIPPPKKISQDSKIVILTYQAKSKQPKGLQWKTWGFGLPLDTCSSGSQDCPCPLLEEYPSSDGCFRAS